MYVCRPMYTFISVIKPVEQHTQTHSVKHKKEKERNNTDDQ